MRQGKDLSHGTLKHLEPLMMPAALGLSPDVGGFKTIQEELAYYKAQYEHLESELLEFQASSRELEAELEKDVEASEKRERALKKTVETLSYEVEEWKSKHKQSKTESNQAQGTLEREVTALRETNRTLQLRLRDVEVVNDDYERTARNTTSSLEDMESKYNVALERSVLLEMEMKEGEQERENLRIETQRLKDELSDMQVETEIVQEKLRISEAKESRHGIQQTSDSKSVDLRSAISKRVPAAPSVASTTMSLAPGSAASTSISNGTTPPSPTLTGRTTPTGSQQPPRKEITTRNLEASVLRKMTSRTSLGGQANSSGIRNSAMGTRPAREPTRRDSHAFGETQSQIMRSASLYQVRGLLGKMQKLEARVQAVKSKMPAPADTPPHSSNDTNLNQPSGNPIKLVASRLGETSSKTNPRSRLVSLEVAKTGDVATGQDRRRTSKQSPPHAPLKAATPYKGKHETTLETNKQPQTATKKLPRASLGASTSTAKQPRLSHSTATIPLSRTDNKTAAPRRVAEERGEAARLPTTRSPVRRQSRGEVRGPPALGISLIRRNGLKGQNTMQSVAKHEAQPAVSHHTAWDDLGETF